MYHKTKMDVNRLDKKTIALTHSLSLLREERYARKLKSKIAWASSKYSGRKVVLLCRVVSSSCVLVHFPNRMVVVPSFKSSVFHVLFDVDKAIMKN